MAESLPNPTFLRQDQIKVGGTPRTGQPPVSSAYTPEQHRTPDKKKVYVTFIEIIPVNESVHELD